MLQEDKERIRKRAERFGISAEDAKAGEAAIEQGSAAGESGGEAIVRALKSIPGAGGSSSGSGSSGSAGSVSASGKEVDRAMAYARAAGLDLAISASFGMAVAPLALKLDAAEPPGSDHPTAAWLQTTASTMEHAFAHIESTGLTMTSNADEIATIWKHLITPIKGLGVDDAPFILPREAQGVVRASQRTSNPAEQLVCPPRC